MSIAFVMIVYNNFLLQRRYITNL